VKQSAKRSRKKVAKNAFKEGPNLTDIRSYAAIACTMRGRRVEFIYDEDRRVARVIRDERTGKRLSWKLTKIEEAELQAFIGMPLAQANARSGM
jgi:hypothetical protein